MLFRKYFFIDRSFVAVRIQPRVYSCEKCVCPFPSCYPKGSYPSNLLMAQQVCLHLKLCWNTEETVLSSKRTKGKAKVNASDKVKGELNMDTARRSNQLGEEVQATSDIDNQSRKLEGSKNVQTYSPPSDSLKEFVVDVLSCRRTFVAEEPGHKVPIGRLKQTIATEKQSRMCRFKIGDFAYTAWISDTLSREVRRIDNPYACDCLMDLNPR